MMSYRLFFLKLGFKNIFRSRLRSGLAIAAIALSVSLIITGMSFITGMTSQFFEDFLCEKGHITIATSDFFEKSRFNPLEYAINDLDKIIDKLKPIRRLEAIVPIIEFGFLIDKDDRNEPVRVTGIDVINFLKFSKMKDNIIKGRFLKPSQKEIILGKVIADKLGITVGDEITAVGKTAHDSFYADGYTVVGIYDAGSRFLNKTAYVPLEQAQFFLDMENQATKILIFGKQYLQADHLKAEILKNASLPSDLELKTWHEDPLISMAGKTMTGVMGSLLFIICFVAGLGILNMMMVSVLERRNEIGVLLALGMNHFQIARLFLAEAICFGFIGSCIGCILGVGPALYLSIKGLTLNMQNIKGIPFPLQETLYGDFRLSMFLIAVLIGISVSIAGMIWPVLKTIKIEPHEIMRK